jgi:hypothetical protein
LRHGQNQTFARNCRPRAPALVPPP